ncbi:MAG: S8/S53 family peptidase [Holophagales bacterium]|nr:S8/S53 family peptidase [Holophagales bacterium]
MPRLAILDTAPTGSLDRATPAFSPHGDTLMRMAQRLLCRGRAAAGETDCAARITSRLTLPWQTFVPTSKSSSVRDEARGGSVGLISDLATAIIDEVDAWKRESEPSGRRPPLVINLSVGWDGELFGGYGGHQPSPAVDAVRQALRHASREGALVIGAAGNRRWGPESETRAVLPAGWEADREPISAGARRPGETGGPAIHAVGGLRPGHHPLVNSRPGATWARLMAFGDHAAVTQGRSPLRTEVLTGTSVSTLVVSATAALVWAQEPHLDAARVIERLYERGEELGVEVEIAASAAAGEEPGHARRVRLCQALPEPGCGPAADTDLGLPGVLDPAQPPRVSHDFGSLEAAPMRVERCGEGFYAGGAAPAEEDPSLPCPHLQLPSGQTAAGTHPQPGSDICPTCHVDLDRARVWMGFSAHLPASAAAVSLELGKATFLVPLPRDRAGPPTVEVLLPPHVVASLEPGTSALVSVRSGPERSLVSPLLILQGEAGGGAP